MENKNEVFNDDKINKNLLIFDKGLMIFKNFPQKRN